MNFFVVVKGNPDRYYSKLRNNDATDLLRHIAESPLFIQSMSPCLSSSISLRLTPTVVWLPQHCITYYNRDNSSYNRDNSEITVSWVSLPLTTSFPRAQFESCFPQGLARTSVTQSLLNGTEVCLHNPMYLGLFGVFSLLFIRQH